MKKIILLMLAVMFTATSFAQKGKLRAAKSAYDNGQYKEAYEAILAASEHEKTKDLPETWVYRAQILGALQSNTAITQLLGIEAGDDELFEALDKAKELDPNGQYNDELAEAATSIINNLHNSGATAFTDDKDYQKASESFRMKMDVREKYMPDADVDTIDYLIVGASEFELGNEEEGVKYYSKLVDYRYDDAAVYNTLINYYDRNENAEKYVGMLKAAQEMYPDNNNYKLLEIDHYISKGEVDTVLDDMLENAEKNPDNVNLLFTISTVYKSKEQPDEERKWLQKALEADPDHYGASFNTGVSYFNEAVKYNDIMNFEPSTSSQKYVDAQAKRDPLAAKAFPYFEKAYAEQPQNDGVLRALIQYHRMMGNKEMKAKFEAELSAVE